MSAKKKGLQIRVASGSFRGRTIDCPPGVIRPMTSMCKQALFNVIQNYRDLSMLDLFSGSASISIEGFSRGIVGTADVVEGDFGKKEVLLANIQKFGLDSLFSIIISDVFNYIKRTDKQYDLIVADPPFNMANKQEIIKIIEAKKILAPKGLLIIHATSKDSLEAVIGDLVCYDRRNYGINSLAFYAWKADLD